MPEWLVIILAAAPGLLAAGGLLVKVTRLERDVEKCVSREVFDVHTKGIGDKLDKIELVLEKLYDRLFERAREDTGEHRRGGKP